MKQKTWYLLRGRQLFRSLLGCILVSAATVAFGQAVVAPPSGSVTVRSVEAMGSGCPAGTVAENISGDNQSFTLAFSEYIAEIGPNISRRERRKICTILVDLAIPAGFRFTLVDVDYRGFADLDEFVRGIVQAKYFFQGDPTAVRSRHFFEGPIFDNYEERDTFGVVSFSPCGGGKTLVFDTEVAVYKLLGSAPDAGGAMGVDTITSTFDQRYAIVWEAC